MKYKVSWQTDSDTVNHTLIDADHIHGALDMTGNVITREIGPIQHRIRFVTRVTIELLEPITAIGG